MTEQDTKDVNTANDFFIGANLDEVGPPMIPMVIRTRQQAYRTAVWIKLMGEMLPEEDPPSTFEEVEEAIMNT